MSDLRNQTPSTTYKGLLQVNDYSNGVDATSKFVQDGEGTNSALSISTTKVGVGTSTPSAPLDVTSTTGGLVFPRLTTTQRDAISSPTNGETIYNTTTTQVESYNGTAWVAGGTTVVANNAVTSNSIANDAVITDKINNNAVTTGKIANDAVTLDKLNPNIIDPSGGLELGTNGLKIATSGTALIVVLRLNASTGIDLNSGTSHVARNADGVTVTDKFKTITEAYQWLSENIASTSVTINIVIETNITESTSANYFLITNNRLGEVRIWSEGLYNHRAGTPPSTEITPPVVTINVDQSSSYASRFVFWFNNSTVIRGIHFVANYGAKGGEYHAFMRALDCNLTLTYCKIEITSSVSTNRVMDVLNNATLRITSDMFASDVSGHEDPFTNGGRAHALEIDITGCSGTLGQCLSIANSSALEMNEFRSGADRDLSGLHFSGNGTATMGVFANFLASSRLTLNTKVSRNSNTTIVSSSVFDGQGYNTLSFGTYTEQGTTEFSKLPGTISYASGFTSPEDFSANETFGSNKATGPVATVSLDTEADYF